MTILDTLTDRKLFASLFADPETWSAWVACLAAIFGLPMTEPQVELHRRCTGRQTPPTAAAREVWCIAGRRAGKSRIAALLAVYVAAFRDYKYVLAPGEKATVAVIAADRQQARVVFRYIVGMIEAVPMLQALVLRQTGNAIELRGNVVIEVHTCSYRTARGYSFAAVIADECAFWRDEGTQAGRRAGGAPVEQKPRRTRLALEGAESETEYPRSAGQTSTTESSLYASVTAG